MDFIDENSIKEIINHNFINNNTDEKEFYNIKNSRLKYFFVLNLNNMINEINDINWLKIKKNYVNQLSDDELNLIYKNINKINNIFLQAKIYDYFWANKYGDFFYNFDKARRLYLKQLKYIVNEKIDNFKYFDISLQRYITLSCISESKKPKYIEECSKNLNNILKTIESKNLINLFEKFFDILLDKRNENFTYYFFEKIKITNRKKINYHFKLFYNLIKNRNDKYGLKKILLNIKKYIEHFKIHSKKDLTLYEKLIFIINKKIFKIYIDFINSIDESFNFKKAALLREAIMFAQQNNINKKILINYKKNLDEIKENIKYYEITPNNKELYDGMNILYQETINKIKDFNFSEKITYMIFQSYNLLSDEKTFMDNINNNKGVRHLFPTYNIDINNNVKSVDNGINSDIQSNFKIACSLINYCYLEPILENIKQNYYFNENMFENLITDNNFIPKSHEIFYKKGLYYFFEKNFIEAFHILIPQIENSLRYIIKNVYPTTVQCQNNTEKEIIDIPELIKIVKEKEIIDKKICFYLDILFNKDYFNIRNNLAHGFDTEYSYLMSPIYNVFVCLLLFILNNNAKIIQ